MNNMTTRLGYLCSIMALLGLIFSDYKVHFAVVSIISFCIAFLYSCKETKKSKEEDGVEKVKNIDSVAINYPDNIIIKSLADDSANFKTIPDIIHETGRSLEEVKHFIDWLFMHGFVTEEKVVNGKTYILQTSSIMDKQ